MPIVSACIGTFIGGSSTAAGMLIPFGMMMGNPDKSKRTIAVWAYGICITTSAVVGGAIGYYTPYILEQSWEILKNV